MKYTELGATGMKVSQIGFGASSLGGVFHDFDENRGIDAVFAAIDAGVNFIDVSHTMAITRQKQFLERP